MKIVWHMPTLRRQGCGLSARAVELAKQLRANGHELSFVVRREKTDIEGGKVDGIGVSTVLVAQRRPVHWCFQAWAKRDAATRIIEQIGGEHDVLISCQPEVVAAYASRHGMTGRRCRRRSSEHDGEAGATVDATTVDTVGRGGAVQRFAGPRTSSKASKSSPPGKAEAISRGGSASLSTLVRATHEPTLRGPPARRRCHDDWKPVVFVCGGTTLLHEGAERADQASLGVVRRLPYAVDRHLKRGNERRAMRVADAVVFDSDHTRELAVTTYGLDPARCCSVHGGVDVGRFRPLDLEARARARNGLGIRASDVVVVWTGRLSPEKNLGLLLRALPRCSRMPDRVLLVGDGPERGELAALVSSLGLGGVVSFVGDQADVRPFLWAGDVFAFPSRGESFGSSLVEAMACGMACLGLAPDGRGVCNANGEIIEHGRSGILAGPAEAAFASALDALIGDEALRRSLGEAARQRVCGRFTWDAGGRRLNDVILKLAEPVFQSDIHAGEAEPKQLLTSEVVR